MSTGMNAGWNQVSTVHQQQFLQQTGLSELPAPSAMTSAQLTALTGIVGESTVESIRQADAGTTAETGSTLAQPKLSRPKTSSNWSALMLAIAKMQMETSELQTEAAVEGTLATRDEMSLSNEKQLEKINESIEKMEDSNSLGTASKVLSWIGIGLTLAAGVALTICTGVGGIGLLVAGGIALTSMILTETGAMDTIVDSLADSIEAAFDTDGKTAKLIAQITVSVLIIAASMIAAGCSGGLTAASSVTTIVSAVSGIVGVATSFAGAGVGVAQSVVNYQSSKSQADASELSAWLDKLQAIMSEQTEMLSQLVQMLSGNISNASEALATLADSQKSIVTNMGV